eukprot:gnl/TRDRNA2_/TRDRNA2_169855_c4_seq1.p1 gnl/TRDRNA2_/TRDRNA2_169855_c4~~gnl/TRDRNA2_/TRDRNA2_169855_c4_seq1.p1  ORF type:complete len:343 (-),score=51.29 gnl/TRDRNA2_/TRDRNA2_169855_c4_seq1:109-1137(-)
MIRAFTEFAEVYSEFYEEIIHILKSIAPLRKMTELLNKAEDTQLWMGINRKRRKMTTEERKVALTKKPSPTVLFRSDMIELKLVDVGFRYTAKLPYVLRNVSLAMPQGSVTAIVGDHGSGKETVMRLLGMSTIADEGLVFIPSYLRCLYVPNSVTLFNMTPWQNLTFGHHGARPKRVAEILTSLNMSKSLDFIRDDLKKLGRASELQSDVSDEKLAEEGEEEEEVEDEEEASIWQDVLSHAERAKMHLARALIMNPEVLALQRPLSHYDENTAIEVFAAIQEHISGRGYKMPREGVLRRRPRTMFLSPSTRNELEWADQIWDLGTADSTGVDIRELPLNGAR